MRVSFERTGGFAGITKKTTVDTDLSRQMKPAHLSDWWKLLIYLGYLNTLPRQILRAIAFSIS